MHVFMFLTDVSISFHAIKVVFGLWFYLFVFFSQKFRYVLVKIHWVMELSITNFSLIFMLQIQILCEAVLVDKEVCSKMILFFLSLSAFGRVFEVLQSALRGHKRRWRCKAIYRLLLRVLLNFFFLVTGCLLRLYYEKKQLYFCPFLSILSVHWFKGYNISCFTISRMVVHVVYEHIGLSSVQSNLECTRRN